MIVTIESPNAHELSGLYHHWHVADEAEALEILQGRTGLFHKSKVLKGFTLFVKVEEV